MRFRRRLDQALSSSTDNIYLNSGLADLINQKGIDFESLSF